MDNKKIFLTGANGYIASNLALFLSDLDIECSGSVRGQSKSKVKGLNLTVVDDMNEYSRWRDLFSGHTCVIHGAGLIHGKYDLGAYQTINVEATLTVAQGAIDAACDTFIFFSSAAVYGNAFKHGVVDERVICLPTTNYGYSKLTAEAALLDLFLSSKTDTRLIILRPPMIYGYACVGNFDRLLRLVRSRLPLPLGSMSGRKNLLFIDTLVQCVARILESCNITGIYNVCDTEALTINELIGSIASADDKRHVSFRFPPRLLTAAATIVGQGSSMDALGAMNLMTSEKLYSQLGWRPTLRVSEAVKQAVST